MQRQLSIQLFLLMIGVSLLISCGDDTTTTTDPSTVSTTTTDKPKKNVNVPRFDREAAYKYIDTQVAFGARVPNTAPHQEARNWMIEEFKNLGTTVIAQDFEATAYTGEVLKGTNIIGQINPAHKRRIVLAAHWDSRHIADHDEDAANHTEAVMGADDGASGVGILLEIAKQLQANPIDLGVDIILFDLEDYGDGSPGSDYKTWCLGSQHWAANMHVDGYKAEYGILLDMVGAPGARFTKEEVSMHFAPKVMNKVWKLAQSMGYGTYFVNDRTRELIDDHLFVNQIAGIPMIDIINRPVGSDTGFMERWHTAHDDMDGIDKKTLRAVGQVLLATLYREAAGAI